MLRHSPRRPFRTLALSAGLTAALLFPAAKATGQAITPLTPLTADQVSHRLTREVFGFLPYWELDAGMDPYLRYDLLTTIAFFGIGANSDGSINTSSPGYKAYMSDLATNVIQKAHAMGVRTVITMESFGLSKNSAFFSDPAAQATFIQQVVALMQLRGADGINVDVELMYQQYFPAYGAFLGALRQAALAVNPNTQISVATNANVSGAQMAAAAMANGVDRAVMMAYDYRSAGTSPVGSIDPLIRAGGGLSLTTSLNYYRQYAVPLDHVILALPYYGRTWPTQTSDLRSLRSTNPNLYSDVFFPKTMPASVAGQTFDYDPVETAARWTYYDTTYNTWVQTYYDDPTTLTPKVALTNQNGMAGMGIWALGYDRGQPGYWDVIANAYAGATITSVSISQAPGTTPPLSGAGSVPLPTVTPPPGMTSSPSVVVSATWNGGVDPVAQIRLSKDGTTWSAWQPVGAAVPWTLAPGPDGPRRVYAQVESSLGVLSKRAFGTVFLDTTAPVAAPPRLNVIRGSAALGLVPAAASWTSTDAGTGTVGYGLESSVDGAAFAPVALPSPGVSAVAAPLALGHTYRYRVTAVDLVGNVGAPVAGPTFRLSSADDRASAVGYSSGWRRTSSGSALGGTDTYTYLKGASVSFRFTGSSVSILAPVGPTRGAARVLIDGRPSGTFSEFSAVASSRQVVFARGVAPGTHTITIIASGTTGRSRIDLDAFYILR